MGILSKILGGSPPAGTHPDSAISITEREDAYRYINQKYVCPSCRRRGGKQIRGHAQVLRRLTNGRGRAYKVYNVFCDCGAFSSFWSDGSSWMDEHVKAAESMCKPSGKCFWIAGSGQMPQMDLSLFDQLGPG